MDVFKFENPDILWGLIIIPIFFLVFYLYNRWKNKRLNAFATQLDKLIPKRSNFRIRLKFIILMLAFASFIFAIANPLLGSKLEKMKRKGVDLVIALDISNSMLARDIKPNRLQKAKNSILQLVDQLQGDRIGLVIFAGKAYTQLPITTDYSAAKMMLNTLSVKDISTQGTAIGAALTSAVDVFDEKSLKNKVIVVITDGENHEDNAMEIVKDAKEKGIIVHTVGMGLAKGAPIPGSARANDANFKKDNQGNIVMSKLNEKMLIELAQAGDGSYFRASNSNVWVKQLFQEINKMEKQEFETKVFTDYESRYQYFLAFGLLLLLIDFLIPSRKSRLADQWKIFNTTTK